MNHLEDFRSCASDRLSPWSVLCNEFEWWQALGLTLDELLTIYRVQFPVLQQNEQRLLFDQRGYVVPMKTIRGVLGPDESHPDYADMIEPFTPVDREADYRVAWAHFETIAGQKA